MWEVFLYVRKLEEGRIQIYFWLQFRKTEIIIVARGDYDMAKVGRPKKAVIKDKTVTVRLSPETYQKLMSYISATGQTITEVVLRGLEKELSNHK